MKTYVQFTLLFIVMAFSKGFSTELAPWFPPVYEIQSKATYLFQHYHKVQNSEIRRTANDQFLILSGLIANYDWNGEAELVGAYTCRQPGRFDCFRFTGRYHLLDDVPGLYPVSLVVGATVTEASPGSLKDLSSFHHGQLEGELHLAAGSEFSEGPYWTTRWWGVFAYGMAADRGSPWMRGDFHFEKNWCDGNQAELFIRTLWGMGRQNLEGFCFPGYANLKHESVDLGASFSYLCNGGLTAKISYSYRVYAHNCPRQASLIMFSLHYPFGL